MGHTPYRVPPILDCLNESSTNTRAMILVVDLATTGALLEADAVVERDVVVVVVVNVVPLATTESRV